MAGWSTFAGNGHLLNHLFGLGVSDAEWLAAQQNAARAQDQSHYNELARAMQNVFVNETSAPYEPPPVEPPKAIPRVRDATIIDMQQRPGEDGWSPVVDS